MLGVIIVILISVVLVFFMLNHYKGIIDKQFKYHMDSIKYVVKHDTVIPLLKHDFNKSGMPIIEVKINKVPYKFMLDSGANINVLDKRVFDILNISKEDTKKSGGFTTASGELDSNVFKADIGFKYKNTSFKEEFEVIDMSGPFDTIESRDGVKINGILGSTFFNKYKWNIDFENLVVWTK